MTPREDESTKVMRIGGAWIVVELENGIATVVAGHDLAAHDGQVMFSIDTETGLILKQGES